MGLDVEQQIAFLKKIDFFENFDDHELRQFLMVTKWLKVPAGTMIIKENAMERVFYILVKGEVSVVKDGGPGKRAVELTTLSSGACFGEMSLVMDVRRTAGVVSTCESFLLMVEPEIINASNVFLQLKFYKRFCEILVVRLILANERVLGVTQTAVPAAAEEGRDVALSEALSGAEDTVTLVAVAAQGEATASVPPAASSPQMPAGLPRLPEKKDRAQVKFLPRKVAAIAELPYNPEVADRLAPLLRGECENTLLLADLIQLDPGLAWKVMQVGNSSYYRRSLPVGTVPHAMITIGIKNVQDVLFELVNKKRPRRPFSGFKQVARAFWRHSLIVARIAALLRDVIRLSLTTDVYLAGLLHDVGILALDGIEPNLYPYFTDPRSELCADICQAESSYIGMDHAQAGAVLAESIGLPEAYVEVIRFHHAPTQARASQLPVALVHLAEVFATIRGCGHCPGGRLGLQLALDSPAWGIIQEFHRPFCEVNVVDFVNSFSVELDRAWDGITQGCGR